MEIGEFALHSLEEAQVALDTALDGLTGDELMWQPQPGANHIAFILWHMFRVEDWFFQYLFQRVPQVWEEEKWHDRLGLPADPWAVGFGYTAEQVDGFPRVCLRDLVAYAKAVRARSLDYLRRAEPATFDTVVRSRVFGETTVGDRVSHLVVEIAQHVGQIGYLRGLVR